MGLETILRKTGFSGLYSTADECGCEIDDLAPCGEYDPSICKPGYRHVCAGCPRAVEHNCPFDCDGYDCTSATQDWPKAAGEDAP